MPSTSTFSSLSRRLKSDEGIKRALLTDGIAVINDGIDPANARELARELSRLRSLPNGFERNKTVFMKDGERYELEKRGVYEREAHAMSEESWRVAAPTFAAMGLEGIPERDALSCALGGRALTRESVKMQTSEGGCFPLHFDSDAVLDSRRLTMLCYLGVGDEGAEEPRDWRKGDGGELIYYGFPKKETLIEPRAGRVVLFSSEFGLHSVLPSLVARRYMFTCWFFAKERREMDAAPPPRPDDPVQQASALLHPSLRKHLTKVVLANEWANSIEGAHHDSESRAAALRTHWDEVQLISQVLGRNYPLGLDHIARAMKNGDEEALASGVEWFP